MNGATLAGKVRRQARLGNIFDLILFGYTWRQPEAAEVVGEDNQTTWLQPFHHQIQQLFVGSLYIKDPCIRLEFENVGGSTKIRSNWSLVSFSHFRQSVRTS